MDVSISKGGKTNPQIVAHKKVSLLVDVCNPCPNLMVINKTRYLLVLDVNGLLCATQHVRFGKRWKLIIPAVQCGNKLVSPQPNSLQFLKLCFSKLEIGI
jgi:hypothetical protein